jgi:hypothetical protein
VFSQVVTGIKQFRFARPLRIPVGLIPNREEDPASDYPRSTAEGLAIPIQLTVVLASRGFGSATWVTSGGPGFVDDLKAQDFSG